MKKQYKLPNRDSQDIFLERTKDNEYKLAGELYYMRFSPVDETKQEELEFECNFVDPDGGPFIGLGYEVEPNVFVSKILMGETGVIITLSEK